MTVVIGSGNPGKLAELSETLRAAGFEPVSGADFAAAAAETGATPRENAEIKAKAYAKASGLPAVAMDSGLFFEELPMTDPRQPGTHVRRVEGRRLSDGEMVAHYAALAESLGGRALCHWVTGFAAALPDGTVLSGDDAERQPLRWKFYLVSEPSGEPLPGKPLSCISLEGDTGRYVNENGGSSGASAERRAASRRQAAALLQKLLRQGPGEGN